MKEHTSTKFIHMMIFFCAFSLGIGILITMQVVSATTPTMDVLAREWRSGWYTPAGKELFEIVTVLGTSKFLAPFTIILSLWLWLRKKDLVAAMVLFFGVALSYVLNKGIKLAVQRSRPEWIGAVDADGFSFPSGGAMLSMLVFTLGAYLLLMHVKYKWTKSIVILVTFIAVFLTGMSRYALGAHFLTDVIAGFSFGFICLALLIAVYKHFSPYNRMSSD